MNTIHLNTSDADLKTLVTQVIADSAPTRVETGSGESVVVMPLKEFSAWQETAYLLSSPANATHLSKSIAEAQSGKSAPRSLDEQ